jgi:hypothetical protein
MKARLEDNEGSDPAAKMEAFSYTASPVWQGRFALASSVINTETSLR